MPLGDDEERGIIVKTLSSFQLYRPSLHSANQLRRTDYVSLTKEHKDLLPEYLGKLEAIDDAIALNSAFVESMLQAGSMAFLNQTWSKSMKTVPSAGDMEKARATVKQMVRDWSDEGAYERELTYSPILETIQEEYGAVASQNRADISILIPGCGLGRLPFEIAKMGYNSVGNEFSYHMLIASNYILNCTTEVGQHKLVPFVHSLSNHKSTSSMLRRLAVPDVVPGDILKDAAFSMAAGEFLECFGGEDSASQYSCVVTCFFLDTAHNVVQYIQTIANVLEDGGLWINVGPCLWHHEHGQDRHGETAFDDEGNYVGSIELSMEEVEQLVERLGFTIESKQKIKTPYMGNRHGMLEHIYHTRLFTARLKKSTRGIAV